VRVGEEQVPTPDYLEPLHARYSVLARTPAPHLTADQTRSLLYFRTDVAVAERPELFEHAQDRVTVWIMNAHSVDDFVAQHGDLPRRNNRRTATPKMADSRHVTLWLEDQRRPAARFRQCDYQRLRIDSYPGLDGRNREERWQDTFSAYSGFVSAKRHAPSGRSHDASERALALWATSQRRMYRAGTLPPERESALRSLSIWTWGSSRRTD
jgi:hypothetical protein